MIRSVAPKSSKRLVIAAIALPLAMLAIFTLSSDAQEKDKAKQNKNKAADFLHDAPVASGLYREFSGVIQLGNYDDKPQKDNPNRYTLDIDGQRGIESMQEYFKAKEPPHVMGGTVYFAVFRNLGASGDTFGTGMPGGLDRNFVPGEGLLLDPDRTRGYSSSPRLDTTAKYLFLFQVVASRGLDSRNQMLEVKADLIRDAIKNILGQEEKNKIKLAVGEEKVKLEKKQKDSVKFLADAVNAAMLPDASIEDVHRFSLQLNVNPRLITSWGYFDGAGFAVNIASTKEYTDRWGHKHKTVADGGVIPNDLVEDRTQAVSFLPGVTEMLKDVDFERVKRAAYSMGVMEGSFHVNDANVGIEKSLPYRFALGLAERGGEIKFASYLGGNKNAERGKKPDFAVKPYKVRIIAGDDRANDFFPEFLDDDFTTSALVVDFDQKGIRERGTTGEVRGIPRTKHSMVFGFTTNLEPNWNRRVRLDDLDSNDRNKDLPFNEFFADKIADKVPARNGFSRSPEYWSKGKQAAGLSRNRQFAFAGKFKDLLALDSQDPLSFVQQPGGGGAAAGGGGAGALSSGGLGVSPPAAAAPAAPGGGVSASMGGSPSGGGMGGGFGMPALGTAGGLFRGGGFGGGGGFGTGSGQAQPSEQQSQTPTQSGNQTINFNASLINQQAQAQQQGQFQIQAQQQKQNQNQHNHNNNHHNHHGHHGHVVPAPASLLLGLLGLPGLFLLRRRKAGDASLETAA